MAFEILMKQVNAIATITGQMHGHISGAMAQAAIGSMTAPVLGAQLMLGDAVRLMAIIEDLPQLDSYDYEIALGQAAYSNAIAWSVIWGDRERLRDEVDMLTEVVAGLAEAMDIIRYQIGQILAISSQLASLQSMTDTQSSIMSQARDLIDQVILPQLYGFRDTVERVMRTYADELKSRDFYLWHIDTVFKFYLPPPPGSALYKGDEKPGKPSGDGDEEGEEDDEDDVEEDGSDD